MPNAPVFPIPSWSIPARLRRRRCARPTDDPRATPRAAASQDRRHRLRGADRAGRLSAAMPEADRVLGNAEKLIAAALGAGARRFRPRQCAEGASSTTSWRCGTRRRASDRCLCRPQPGFRAGAERLRSPLHVLHHPVRPRQFALGADGRRGRRRAPARRQRLREIVLTGVDITSYGADLPGAPKLGTLVKQILKHVPELKRLRLSSIDSVEADRDLLDAIGGRGAADAASAPVAAIGRRSHPQAHEAAAPARRCRSRSARRRAACGRILYSAPI